MDIGRKQIFIILSGIQIFKSRIDSKKIIFYLLILILLAFINFYIKPLIKKEYLHEDIEKFNSNVSWKINLIIWGCIFLFVWIFKAKTIQSRAESILVFLFLVIFTFMSFTGIITNISLYINQLTIQEKEREVFLILSNNIKSEKYIHLLGNEISITVYDEKNLEKIDEIRNKNGLKPLNEISNRDTINIVFKKGLLDFKYLK